LLHRLSYAFRDHRRVVVESKHHDALESLWACDEDAEATLERVGGNPRFVRAAGIPAARDDGRFNALPTITGNAFDVEDRERHTANCTAPNFRVALLSLWHPQTNAMPTRIYSG